ncbi:MAG: hypothetical protein GY904_04290 [Planctomycetaceae bacterium]|jgi:hypothetical protein|nr:hypothetical protein [Planctomycetaceae bacterium]
MSDFGIGERHACCSVRQAHHESMRWTAAACIASFGLLMAVRFGWPAIFRWSPADAAFIAVGSWVVAWISLAPGLRMTQHSSDFCQVLLVGIIIRLLGTVALFLTCRYHLASSAEVVAGMIIGWYVLLTFIEVFVLSRCQANADSSNATNSGQVDNGQSSPEDGCTPEQQNI